MSTPPACLNLHILRPRRQHLGQTYCGAPSTLPWLPPHHPSPPYQINNFSTRRLVFCVQHHPGQVPDRRLVFLLSCPDRPHPQARRPIWYPMTKSPLCWSISARAPYYLMCVVGGVEGRTTQ